MFTDDDLLRALADCLVPGQRRNVVEAGLVRSARVARDHEAPGTGIAGVPERYAVHVVLSAPGGDEAVNAQLRAVVENRLLGLPAVSGASVTLRPALFAILTNER